MSTSQEVLHVHEDHSDNQDQDIRELDNLEPEDMPVLKSDAGEVLNQEEEKQSEFEAVKPEIEEVGEPRSMSINDVMEQERLNEVDHMTKQQSETN